MKPTKGFTLIEVLMAFALFSVVGGLLIALVIDGMSAREKSQNLLTAVRLAAQKMDAIKIKRQEDSAEGKFSAFAGFSYQWEIKTIELDLAKMLSEESHPENNPEESEDSKTNIARYLKEFGLSKETVTGAVFKMLRYQVTVYYPENKSYQLVFYRGLGVF